MSGLAVVIRRSGEPVPVEIIEAMRAALLHRAPDGVDVTTRENVAVVFGRLHATPEAQFERQPHECGDGTWLVADIRLDNRAEVIARLGWRRSAATTSDIELLAAWYEQHRERTPDQLLGDFATVAIERSGRVVCFRDHLGIKPLYYWVDDEWLVIGSELRQIAAHPAAPRAPNVALLGEYLSGWVESTTETVIRGIRRLPAAHALVIDKTGLRQWRYWVPPFDEQIELADPVDYEDRFRALFADAVRCRLRAAGPVGSELSGGLDSTSVTAMAARMVRSDEVSANAVYAFSCLFPWSSRAREDSFIREAVEALDLDWTPIVDDPAGAPWVWDDAAFWSDIPLPPDGPEHEKVGRAARDRGCSVVLTGHGGDHSFDPSPYVLLDLVQDGHWSTAWRAARSFAGSGRRAAALLLRTGIAPHRPSWVRNPRPARRAPAVAGAARAEARLDERRVPGRLARSYRRLRAQRHFEQCAGGYDAMSFEIFDRGAARAGVEFRHPYFDRRLVEFGCQVPVAVHAAPGINRRLQRRGLRDVLPPAIATRRSKARFTQVWLRTIERHLPDASWPETLVVRNGWVDLAEARAALRHTRARIASPRGAGQIFFLWGMVQVESVLRTLRDAGGHAP